MTVERMAPADAAWLHMDRPANLMVVNCVFWFDEPLDAGAVAAAFADRVVGRFPRLAQRVAESPVAAGPLAVPYWRDVEGFDARAHIRLERLPEPGDDGVLHAYVSRQAAMPLDPARPLWEAHVLHGYRCHGRDGSAVLLRTHHAIADGTALVQALLTLADPHESGRHVGQRPLVPPAGGRAGLVQRLGEAGAAQLEWASRMAGRLTAVWSSPRQAVAAAAAWRGDAAALARVGAAASDDPSPLRVPLSGVKSVTWSSPVPLTAVKQAARAADATVNDLALGVIAGALRRLLVRRGSPVGRLTAIVPVNLRPAGEPLDPRLGNHFGLVFVRLPVDEPDAVRRIAAVKAEMDRIKASRESVVVYGALEVMGMTPAAIQQAWQDLFTGRATAVVTNIMGPPGPLRLTGVPLRGFAAWVPATGPIGIGLSICSYAGDIVLGVATDTAVMPDARELLHTLQEEMDEVKAALTTNPEP
jgi:diacylglycerol O-acyltransferase